ncbi:LacI family DNA-binding transcriptional regulator [Flagellimonas pacifica]|uniref:Transcriptional regulator, LacI family n=1 Tax=Flagellimonas pacifica TaxID=1247520 RepID=A0A285MTE9_9FLAO|nr:LacI family DNA-binding transcriptional regulator [Allomuricauda parva]SNZ00465.1 transcriptional regulator, LacI family [Allomuricauda parva]
MKKKHTIKDIAQAAGVSIGTVDRVLHKRGKVSEKALKAVTDALNNLNYKPNPIARTLKNNTIYSIKVLLPDPEMDPYWKRCMEGINETIEEFSAFDLEIETHCYDPSEPSSFSKTGEQLIQTENLNALLFVPLFEMESNALLKKLGEKQILSATFNSSLSNDLIDQHTGQDLYSSGRVGAKLIHSLIKPDSKIAIVHIDEAFNNAVHMKQKEQGFISFFKDFGSFQIQTLTLNSNEFEVKFPNFVTQFDTMDAFFVTTSKAYEIVKALKKENKKCSIVGYDLLPRNVSCLKTGEIDFLIHQSPKTQASLGLRGLIETLIFGKEIPKKQLLPIDIVNSENVDSYLI